MLQRLQSLLLLFAVLLNLGMLVTPFWKYTDGAGIEYLNGLGIHAQTESGVAIQSQRFTANGLHLGMVLLAIALSAFLAFIIFQYNNRSQQIRLCQFALMGLSLQIMLMVAMTQAGPFVLDGNTAKEQAQAGIVLPALALVLAWWAMHRIRKDEALVRSVDRFR